MNTVPVAMQVSLLHVVEPSGRSVSNHPSPPRGPGLVSHPRLTGSTTPGRLHPFFGTIASVGLRHLAAGSPRRQAESSSSSYGLAVHLRLLSTSSHENAVTIGYKVQTLLWRGLPPRGFNALTGALPWPRLRGHERRAFPRLAHAHDKRGHGSTSVSVFCQKGGSPFQVDALRLVAERNCVAARRGGEYREANDQSATYVNSIRPGVSASLLPIGEAQTGNGSPSR